MKPRVLVIDDDIRIRKVLKDTLRKEYDVRAVESVESAFVEIEQGFMPQVAIVDYLLGEVKGDEFIKRLPDACAHIMITAAKVDSDFVSEMMQLGALYVLRKPFSLVELKAMVKKALEQEPADV